MKRALQYNQLTNDIFTPSRPCQSMLYFHQLFPWYFLRIFRIAFFSKHVLNDPCIYCGLINQFIQFIEIEALRSKLRGMRSLPN